VNTSFGHLHSAVAAADRQPAGSAPQPHGFRPENSQEPVRGAEFGCEPPGSLPSCGALLGDFLALIEGIERDFVRRWDAARFGASIGTHPQAVQTGWQDYV
jgi:hypothetical protein